MPKITEPLAPYLVQISKAVSRVLRHRPSSAGVTLDSHGWCVIDALLTGLTAHGESITREQLDVIVTDNSKQRFAVSQDGFLIRATQGHSLKDVDVQPRRKVPPTRLFHGTVSRNVDSIALKGLLPMNRQHVHLSVDVATAADVGSRRRGQLVIFEVDTHQMHADEHTFRISENDVWLVACVPAKYLSICG